MAKQQFKKRADGRYSSQIYLGTVDGKRKYKTVYGNNPKELKEKIKEAKVKMGKGLDLLHTEDTFTAWKDNYLMYKQIEVTDEQYNLIKSRSDIWAQYIGGAKIGNIRVVDLQPILNMIAKHNPHTGKPSAKKTLISYIQILRNIFDYAIDNRALDYNPAARLKAPSTAPKNERRSLTKEERQRVIEFEHRGQTAMMLLMLSGLRRGEATALLWSDIDFKAKTISVTKSFDFKAKTLKPPKNGKPRIVSIPQKLVDYLKGVERGSPYVLVNAQGNMMTTDSWRRLLESYLFDMNLKYGKFRKNVNKFAPEKIPMAIEPFTLHCLRHTFCTIMYESGVDVLVAQKQMGHADVTTTLKIYTHLQEEHEVNNIAQIDEYLA